MADDQEVEVQKPKDPGISTERIGYLRRRITDNIEGVNTDFKRAGVTPDDINRRAKINLAVSRLREQFKTEEALARVRIDDKNENLLNELGFKEALARAISHAERTGEPLTVALLDLNGFKQVNDALGHDIGDIVLGLVGDFLNGNIRPQDAAARLHGDEFAILFPDGLPEGVRQRLLELRDQVMPEYIETQLQERGINGNTYVSTSIGISSFQQGDTPDTILKRADENMYKDKREGKQGR